MSTIQYPYQDSSLPVEERIEDLLLRLSPEEKIGQLCKPRGFSEFVKSPDGSFKLKERYTAFMSEYSIGCLYGLLRSDPWTGRNFENGAAGKQREEIIRLFTANAAARPLPIPLLLAEEAPHGLDALEATVFPCALAIGATFDADLSYRIGYAIGREGLAAGINTVYAPILDLALDPRWSRVEECYGEDPELVATMGESCFKGLRDSGILPLLKHYVGGGASASGLNQQPARFGDTELYNSALRPFRRCINSGAKALMSTYHDIDGEPCTGSYYLLTEILRKHLGYCGFVTADGGAVELLKARRLASSFAEAASRALRSGCDMESGHAHLEECGQMLREAFRQGLITVEDLDHAVRRVLRVKFEMGLFDRKPSFNPAALRTPEHRALALRAARESVVLVKNSNRTLPLTPGKFRRIALTGPNADNVMNQLGDYTSFQRPEDVTTLLAALRNESGYEIIHTRGCSIRAMDRSGFAAAVQDAQSADCCIAVVGGSSWHDAVESVDAVTGAVVGAGEDTSSTTEKESGEGTDRATLSLCGVQMELLRALKQTGRPLIVIMLEGRPLQVDEILGLADAVLISFYPGEAGGTALADILTGRVNPSGRLPVSIPYSTGQLPVYYNTADDRAGRFYLDSPAFPALEFAFGLSYTTFDFSNLTVEGRKVKVQLRNSGDRPGEEVAFFFLTACGDVIQRPWCELCHFERHFLQPGESRLVTFTLTDEMLYWYDRNGKRQRSVNHFTLRAGGNLREVQTADFTL